MVAISSLEGQKVTTPNPGKAFSSKEYHAPTTPGKGTRKSYVLDDVGSEDEKGLARRVRELFQAARDHKRDAVTRWNRNTEVLQNRTWLGGRPRWMPSPEVPEVRPILHRVVGHVTDSRPTIDCIPFSDPGSENWPFLMQMADDLTTTIEASFISNGQEYEVARTVYDAYRNGTGFLKTCWDQSMDGGLGGVRVNRVNPFHIFVDPYATCDEELQYICEVRTMSMQELDRRFPGATRNTEELYFGKDNDDQDMLSEEESPRLPMANPGSLDGSHFPHWGMPGQTRESVKDSVHGAPVSVIEMYLRAHKHKPARDDAPQPTATEEDWRCVVVSGNRVLLDEYCSDLFGYPKHPYDRYCPEEESQYWAVSMVELLTPSQLAINRSLAAIQQNLELVGNPMLKENTRSRSHRMTLTNKPGLRVPIGDGGDVEWLQPPDIHPDHFRMIQFHIERMENVSGVYAHTSAQTGRNSSDVMNAQQEQGFVRIRLALRNLEKTLHGVFLKYADLVVHNYTAERVVAVVGPSGEKMALALSSRHFHVETPKGAIPTRYMINVQAGSQMPVSPQAMAEKANMLFQMGAIDEIALLQAHRWPKADQVYERVMSQRQAMMTAANAPDPGSQPALPPA